MRSLRFLQDLQFGLGFEDHFGSKNRPSNSNILRFTPSKISRAPCWLYLRDIFLLNVSMCKMSFIHSLIRSTNFTLNACWDEINVSSRVWRFPIPHPSPHHFLATPTGQWAANLATCGYLLDVSESASPILNCWYHSHSQALFLAFSSQEMVPSIHHSLKLEPGRHSWHFFDSTPKSNPACRGLSINIDQRNRQVVEREGEWMNNALSCLHLPFQHPQESLMSGSHSLSKCTSEQGFLHFEKLLLFPGNSPCLSDGLLVFFLFSFFFLTAEDLGTKPK